jgi:hypothetical protein
MSGTESFNNAGGDEKSAGNNMGLIEINDLVYRMESDLSCSINRTHKNSYFQQTQYDQTQTSTCIINSGADYIDARRSFLTLTIVLPPTTSTNGISSDPTDPMYYAYISAYFGANGSVLNLIDNVVVTTRSGDEISRINDYGTLMYHYIPWTFGKEWRRTIGQQIGLGSYLGGQNSNLYASENTMATFNIPLYLLTTPFTYGRLQPAMFMSGLKIEIRWKPLGYAVQQFWENAFQYPRMGSYIQGTGTLGQGTNNHQGAAWLSALQSKGETMNAMTQDRAYLGAWATSTNLGASPTRVALDNTITDTTAYSLTDNGDGTYIFAIETSPAHNSWAEKQSFNQEQGVAGNFYQPRQAWLPGLDQVGFTWNTASSGSTQPYTPVELIFDVLGYYSANSILVAAAGATNYRAQSTKVYNISFGTGGGSPTYITPTNATQARAASSNDGMFFGGNVFRQSKYPFRNVPQHQFSAPVERYKGTINGTQTGQGLTGSVPLSSYTILNPFFQLCSVQLSDSIQRHLNEYSATNGLEIVFADWDRTSQSLSGTNIAVYTEVRKSASRALQAFSVVTPTPTASSYQNNSFESLRGGYWRDYQFQLGSLYFPQQRVESKSAIGSNGLRDDMYALTYAFAADSFDRWHPKASPCMMSFRGDLFPFSNLGKYVYELHSELRDDNGTLVNNPLVSANWPSNVGTALVNNLPAATNPPNFGQDGSFCNGGQIVACTLERSSAFDLSGIPINNSRVLALRGDYINGSNGSTAQQFIFLKYVRIARIFLINVEVEQ